jgi:hypothetical protein
LDQAEFVLRRFNPEDPLHAEPATDDSPIRPKYGAFYFKDDECSVYREAVLSQRGLNALAITRDEYSAVLRISVESITTVEVPTPAGNVRPFAVVDHAWPFGEPGNPIDEAHAEIVMDPISRSAAKLARRALVKRVSDVLA